MSLMEDDVEEEAADKTPKSDEKTNEDIMKAITSLKNGLYKKINVQLTITEMRKQVQECTGRITHAEQRISDAEDNVNELLTKVNTLENTVKTLTDKVDDLECRSRRNNVRLVGLPEKAAGQDAAGFLERCCQEPWGWSRGELW